MHANVGRTRPVRAKQSVRAKALPPIEFGSSGDPIYIADAVVSAVVIGAVLAAINAAAGTGL